MSGQIHVFLIITSKPIKLDLKNGIFRFKGRDGNNVLTKLPNIRSQSDLYFAFLDRCFVHHLGYKLQSMVNKEKQYTCS